VNVVRFRNGVLFADAKSIDIRDRQTPLFLDLAFTAPHALQQVPRAYLDRDRQIANPSGSADAAMIKRRELPALTRRLSMSTACNGPAGTQRSTHSLDNDLDPWLSRRTLPRVRFARGPITLDVGLGSTVDTPSRSN